MTDLTIAAPGYLLPGGLVAEWRNVGTVTGVSKRTITVIAVPYDEQAHVTEPDGREFVESFDRHAFDGVQTRNGKVAVNRDHDVFHPIGQAVKLYPNRREGLVAELRMSAGVDGADEALSLAGDGLLGASISFGAAPDDVEWFDRGARRVVHRAMIDHIALTAVPAYAGATVLDVRHRTPPPASAIVTAPVPDTSSSTPRLDAIMEARRMAELRSAFES